MDSDEYDSSNSRRSSLAISALLNDDSVDPVKPSFSSPSRKLTAEEKRENRKTWHGFVTDEVPKAKRKRISTQQFNRLMDVFQQTDTPSSEIREHLAEELDMTKREVQVWFQNRRAKASRARVAAATSTSNGSALPSAASMLPNRYDHYSLPDSHHHHHYQQQQQQQQQYISPAPGHTMSPVYSYQQQAYLSHTPQPSRRASAVLTESSSSAPPPIRPASSLQPIAPMPPPVGSRRPAPISTPSTASLSSTATPTYSHPTPPTPPYAHPIAPRKHSIHQGFENLSLRSRDESHAPAKKRPKSVIEMFKTTL